MSGDAAPWIQAFLKHRGLSEPDGRPLYAYRCDNGEFASLQSMLCDAPSTGALDSSTIRAFVLYAAEWWQRRYDGGRWAWDPLLASIIWRNLPFPYLYDPVRRALTWWRVELVRLSNANRYLGTFACQGGLPLAFVDESSRITTYLRAVLRHAATTRQFVEDPIDLAIDQQHLLRPPTLRRDYVFRLAADLVDAVLDLRDDAQDEDPLSSLDQARPDWRDAMPLALDDERARVLLIGLLREARDKTPPASNFRVVRYLRRTGIGWRLGARIELPKSLSRENLARQLGVSDADLPPRLQVRVTGDRVRVVGLYAARADDYLLMSRGKERAGELWDQEAAAEIRIQFFAQRLVGEAPLRRGAALGELPWAFRSDKEESAFIGEGSVSDRSPEIVLLVPEDCTVDRADVPVEHTQVLNRHLWRVSEPIVLKTTCGDCTIRPSSEQMVDEDYRLSGQRMYDLKANYPLFRGPPRLRVAKPEQPVRAVSGAEVSWRRLGGDWQGRPDSYGQWDVRHVQRGQLRHVTRVGVLPESFGVEVQTGSVIDQGRLLLAGAAGAKISAHGSDARVSTRPVGGAVSVHVVASDPHSPPATTGLRLQWDRSRELIVKAPFPGEGARFLRDGNPFVGPLALDDLYGVRATALSTDSSQSFWIEGELKASDLGSLRRVAHFRRPLEKTGVTHELPLVDIGTMIALLLGASSSPDAKVVLTIFDRAKTECAVAEVKRFQAALVHDASMVSVSETPSFPVEAVTTFEALPLVRPDVEPLRLPVVDSAGSPHCAVLPEDLKLDEEPWLVVLRHDDRVRVQPIVVGGTPTAAGGEDADSASRPSLSEALLPRDPPLRLEAVRDVLNAMQRDEKDEQTDSSDEDWSVLNDMLLRAEGLPANSLDLLTALVERPKLLVRCLFRLDSAPRKLLWELEEELPFSWVLIPRDVWWSETNLAYEQFVGLIGDSMAREQVDRVLDEGVEKIAALCVTAADVAVRLEGGSVSESFVDSTRVQRDEATPDLIKSRVNLDDWPRGYGRDQWRAELGQLPDALWQDPNELPERQPIFDTPVAAAWCCFVGNSTPRTTFLVQRIRSHDPEWFDVAYGAAWARLARAADNVGKRR